MKRPAKPRRTAAERKQAAHLLTLLKAGKDARVRNVRRVRAKVRMRSYENELKLSVAMDRMLKEICS